MMFKLTTQFIVASLAIASAWGRAVGSGTAWHEKRLDALPEGYETVSPAPSDAPITLRIALTQRDFSGLEKALYKASTPGTPEYGNWLSKSQVESYIRPSDSAISAVESWLSSHGLSASSLSPAGDWITVNATVSQADRLLSAEFTTFKTVGDGEGSELIRALEYSVPDEVKEFVRTVHPTTVFPVTTRPLNHTPGRHILTPSSGSDQPLSRNITRREGPAPVPSLCIPDPAEPLWMAPYTLDCRFAYYGIPKELAATVSGNSLWISGFANQFVHRTKVQGYLDRYRPELGPVPFAVVSIDGGINNQLPLYTSIANVMMLVAASTAYNVPLTFMTVGTDPSPHVIDWLLSQADYLLAMEDPPKVVVIAESMAERTVPRALAEYVTLCAAYAQLSARGVTLLHAQLLSGVDPRNLWEYDWPVDQRECPDGFDVSFPASCPYVTSVGGSMIDLWNTDPLQEAAIQVGDPSNGGWSNIFPRPAYQDADVDSYLGALGDKHQGMFDPVGRATPDIAAFAALEDPISGGYFLENPSYSAALFASMIAIINGERMAAGKSAMGFLNPWIYANKGAFNDITMGSNPGCFTDGFSAGEGWDPVTGVGSPMFARLRAAAIDY